jgi:VWFA-related protein
LACIWPGVFFPPCRRSRLIVLAKGLVAISALCLASLLPAGGQSHKPGRPARHHPTAQAQPERTPVHVCVVVRGPGGKVITGLRRRNFQLFDDGRRQRITDFAENLVLPPPSSRTDRTTPRYIALYFDDIHMDFAGVVQATDGAYGYFSHHLGPWDRIGIFTASGQNTLDFTHDLAKLHQTLLAIRPHPPTLGGDAGCPKITDFEATLILYAHDSVAREVALEAALRCGQSGSFNSENLGRPSLSALHNAQRLVDAEAHRTLSTDEPRASKVIEGLNRLVSRVSKLPDPRSITFISPGFITAKFGHRLDQISERALSLNIIVNAIDMSSQISEPDFRVHGLSRSARRRVALSQAAYSMRVDGASMAAEILIDLPASTGGTFVPNTYSAESAFPKAIPLPSSYYVLTFYPRFLRPDGRFHRLRVALVRHAALYVQARDGYYAPGTINLEIRPVRRARSLLRGRH